MGVLHNLVASKVAVPFRTNSIFAFLLLATHSVQPILKRVKVCVCRRSTNHPTAHASSDSFVQSSSSLSLPYLPVLQSLLALRKVILPSYISTDSKNNHVPTRHNFVTAQLVMNVKSRVVISRVVLFTFLVHVTNATGSARHLPTSFLSNGRDPAVEVQSVGHSRSATMLMRRPA